MIDKSTQRGFTLIEVVIVALLMAILALGAFALFNMYMNTTRETTAHLRMQRQAEALVDEVARRVRRAAYVFQEGENPIGLGDADDEVTGGGFVDAELEAEAVNEIIIRDSDNVTQARFRIHDTPSAGVGVIQISEGETTNWTNFTVDGTPIFVNSSDSWFGLWFGRKQVRIDMTLRTVASNGEVFTLNVQRGAFRCRN
ncbi:MAG: prepilin-type N-terminal cleavage/methylation domain-containing protein [Chitinispirillales bacterium]|jgi:prepilin-type N-terminal cleavage/methylation domain-containing protein|nr:prepilin-type N-terminal cleavage/methylation domain-containing protein [Chitinispirillales bacterium]